MISVQQMSWILPAHNEAETLPKTIQRIQEFALQTSHQNPIQHHVIIVENGSTDKTWQTAEKLTSASTKGLSIHSLKSTEKGMGYAYALGIRHAAHLNSNPSHWIVLSAADLPFGFTDYESFFLKITETQDPCLVIGSKRHPQSIISRSFGRTLMSHVFSGLRYLALASRVRDSQGTLFLQAHRALRLMERTQARDFFFSTELIFRAEQEFLPVHEVPITLEPELRKSTVHPFRDSWRMARQVFRLWQKS